MSRPIKFRGKRMSNGEWVYGGLVKSDNGDMHILQSNKKKGKEGYKLDYWLVDPETVCQYVGLTDRNGKEVYEGDIIKAQNNRQVGTVIWDQYEYKYVVRWAKDNLLKKEYDSRIYEAKRGKVIGSVYTHPHLMEVSNG